jgi:hypothetical protein
MRPTRDLAALSSGIRWLMRKLSKAFVMSPDIFRLMDATGKILAVFPKKPVGTKGA